MKKPARSKKKSKAIFFVIFLIAVTITGCGNNDCKTGDIIAQSAQEESDKISLEPELSTILANGLIQLTENEFANKDIENLQELLGYKDFNFKDFGELSKLIFFRGTNTEGGESALGDDIGIYTEIDGVIHQIWLYVGYADIQNVMPYRHYYRSWDSQWGWINNYFPAMLIKLKNTTPTPYSVSARDVETLMITFENNGLMLYRMNPESFMPHWYIPEVQLYVDRPIDFIALPNGTLVDPDLSLGQIDVVLRHFKAIRNQDIDAFWATVRAEDGAGFNHHRGLVWSYFKDAAKLDELMAADFGGGSGFQEHIIKGLSVDEMASVGEMVRVATSNYAGERFIFWLNVEGGVWGHAPSVTTSLPDIDAVYVNFIRQNYAGGYFLPYRG